MKIDPGMHIGLHLVFFGKTGVTEYFAKQQHVPAYKLVTIPPT
jgi:hypothetical protein